jgi:hypothetical protein
MPGLRFKIDFCLLRFAGFSSRLDVREGYSGMQSGLVEVKLPDGFPIGRRTNFFI